MQMLKALQYQEHDAVRAFKRAEQERLEARNGWRRDMPQVAEDRLAKAEAKRARRRDRNLMNCS